MTTAATPEAITDELAEIDARRERLQAKANAINTAVREAHDRVEKSYYRRMATKVATEHRNQRDAAKAELDAAMVADPLDPIKLAAKLVALKDADARCGAVAAHAGRLDYLDPLPPNAIGAPRVRPCFAARFISSSRCGRSPTRPSPRAPTASALRIKPSCRRKPPRRSAPRSTTLGQQQPPKSTPITRRTGGC
jgi:hypothetical protein